MITVAVQGAQGRLGSKIVAQLTASNIFSYAGPVKKGGNIPDCSVVVAVAGDTALAELLPRLTNEKLLVGSTGDLPIDDLELYAQKNTVFLAPNFSQGMQLLYKLIRTLSQTDVQSYNLHIQDVHHVHKKDSPSGTAKKMKNIADEIKPNTKIQSERSAEVLGDHALILENEYERLTIEHEVLHRDVYAEGCLKLIEEIVHSQTGLYQK